MLKYMDAKAGFFCGTTGIFDAQPRYEYLRTVSTLFLRRGDVLPSRKLVERLMELGYEHSPHLSRPHTYSIQGSEAKIRDGRRILNLSYFDDEIDDLLIGDETGETTPVRLHEATIYIKDGEPLPETSTTIQAIG